MQGVLKTSSLVIICGCFQQDWSVEKFLIFLILQFSSHIMWKPIDYGLCTKHNVLGRCNSINLSENDTKLVWGAEDSFGEDQMCLRHCRFSFSLVAPSRSNERFIAGLWGAVSRNAKWNSTCNQPISLESSLFCIASGQQNWKQRTTLAHQSWGWWTEILE